MKVILCPAIAIVLVCAAAGCSERYGGSDRSTAAVDSLRILAYNIHHGEGMDEALDLRRIAALIRELNPDLVALQEVDSVTARTERVDQAAELGRLTGLDHVFGSFMPYQGGAYGMALLSKWPIRDTRNVRLPDGEEPRSALVAVLSAPVTGQDFRFVGIHFYRTEEERLAQARKLIGELDAEDEPGTGRQLPTILAGDFNSTPGSVVMAYFAAGWENVEKGDDHFTFSSFAPSKEIDFVLMRPKGAFEVTNQWLVDEPVASDHRPVVVDLLIRQR